MTALVVCALLLVVLAASLSEVGAYPAVGEIAALAAAPPPASASEDTPGHDALISEVGRDRLLELIHRVDLNRCFAKWACDILARDEEDRAAEEQELADLFTDTSFDETAEPSDSARRVYLAAALRGRKARGDRKACHVSTCKAKPEQMLQMLRKIQLLGGEAGRAGISRNPHRERLSRRQSDEVHLEIVEGEYRVDRYGRRFEPQTVILTVEEAPATDEFHAGSAGSDVTNDEDATVLGSKTDDREAADEKTKGDGEEASATTKKSMQSDKKATAMKDSAGTADVASAKSRDVEEKDAQDDGDTTPGEGSAMAEIKDKVEVQQPK